MEAVRKPLRTPPCPLDLPAWLPDLPVATPQRRVTLPPIEPRSPKRTSVPTLLAALQLVVQSGKYGPEESAPPEPAALPEKPQAAGPATPPPSPKKPPTPAGRASPPRSPKPPATPTGQASPPRSPKPAATPTGASRPPKPPATPTGRASAPPSPQPTPAGPASAPPSPQPTPASPGASSPPPSPKPPPSPVVINRTAFTSGWREGSAQKYFTWNEDDQLGHGSFGKVFRGRSNFRSNRTVAVKQIERSAVDDADQLWAEIRILSELDHPNILRFLEAYHDSKHIYVITEVCLGGSLVEWASRMCGNLDFAARVVQEITGALAYCHSRNVVHRDLKLDNVLLVRNSPDSPIRVADFGLAKRCSQRVQTQRLKWAEARAAHSQVPDRRSKRRSETADAVELDARRRSLAETAERDEMDAKRKTRSETTERLGSSTRFGRQATLFRLCSFKGTAEYMAPEVIRILDIEVNNREEKHFYDYRCDVWSLGVVAHMLLRGELPYSVEEVSAFVAEGRPLPEGLGGRSRESGDELPPDVEDFIRCCLSTDFHERPMAQDLIRHPWLMDNQKLRPAPSPEKLADLLQRLKGYQSLSFFKRAALTAAVRHLGAYEYEQLRGYFEQVDVDNSGRVTPEKLCAVLLEVSGAAKHEECELAARALDSDQSGEIDFTEFLAAVMDQALEEREDLALAAFRAFDLDGDGLISKKELTYVFEGLGAAEEALRLGDGNEDGELDFEEFLALLRRG